MSTAQTDAAGGHVDYVTVVQRHQDQRPQPPQEGCRSGDAARVHSSRGYGRYWQHVCTKGIAPSNGESTFLCVSVSG